MDDKKIAALAKKNAAKAAKSSGRKGFGKKYDKNLADLPTDEATLKERQEHERFFKEMRDPCPSPARVPLYLVLTFEAFFSTRPDA